MTHSKTETCYVVTYRDPQENKNVTLRVKNVGDSKLGLSFVCLSGFLFSENTTVVNPTEDNLKKRLVDTKALHISIYSILSIEEVGKENKGLSFKKSKSNLIVLGKDQ